MKVIALAGVIVLSGCCNTFCKPVYIPVPAPVQKVKLEPEPKCDTTTPQTPDAEVVRAAIKCIKLKSGHIQEMRIRLRDYIQ